MDDISACYRILDLEPGASLEDVKCSYRELVKVWHPDRFRGDPKLQAKAEEKLKRINLAYERLSQDVDSGVGRRTSSQHTPKPYPERTRPERRAPQYESAKNTQAQAHRAHPQRAATGGNKSGRLFHWVRQPWVATVLIGFVIVVLGMIVVAVQSGRRKNAGLATTSVPKIANDAIERNENTAQILKAAAQKDPYGEAALTLAIENWQKAADQGDPAAQSKLGLFYAEGTGVKKDEAKAVEWFRKAAAQGYAFAQLKLGVMYENGRGVAKDETKAVEWYAKAAAQGDAAAQFNLGGMYHSGTGVAKDTTKAVDWYQKAAAQGNAEAQFNLGLMYATGRGISKDEAKAVDLYQKVAAQGYAAAQHNLGLMYADGRGVANDDAKAFEWWEKAAAQGNAEAGRKLSIMYATGRGIPSDDQKAFEWYQKAASQGYSYAQSKLAAMYDQGRGVPKDRAKAAEWYQKAAGPQNVTPYQLNQPSQPPITNTTRPEEPVLRHLATDGRLTSGSVLVDELGNFAGKGKLTLDNGLLEDAYVKLVLNHKLVAAFYVRSREKFTYSTIPDGIYTVVYCVGYGWDGAVRNFARGRHARRYDNPLNYSTNQERDASGVTTYTDVVTLTLHKVAGGSAKASDISLEDFDRY